MQGIPKWFNNIRYAHRLLEFQIMYPLIETKSNRYCLCLYKLPRDKMENGIIYLLEPVETPSREIVMVSLDAQVFLEAIDATIDASIDPCFLDYRHWILASCSRMLIVVSLVVRQVFFPRSRVIYIY